MSAKSIAAVVGFAAIVLVVVLVMRSTSRDGSNAVVVRNARESREGSPSSDGGAAAQRVEEAAAKPVVADATRLTMAKAIETGIAVLTPADPDGLEVRVVHREDGKAAGGAIVGAVDIDVIIRSRLSIAAIARDLRKFAEGMLFVRADEGGVARLPRRFTEMMLIAELGELRGASAASGSETRPREIELSPPTTVRAQVVDEGGRPTIGADVRLESRQETTRAPDGIATFADLEFDWNLMRERKDGLMATMSVWAPLIDAPSADVDLWHPPAEPVPLRVSGSGSLVLNVVDEERRTIPVGGTAQLEWIDRDQRDRPSSELLLDESGKTAVPCVEAGHRFKLTATLTERTETSCEIVGPRWAGDIVNVDVPLGHAHAVLVGRVVDSAGRPLTTSGVTGTLRFAPSSLVIEEHPLFGRLDENGAFRIDWTAREFAPEVKPESIRWRAISGPPLESGLLPFPELPEHGEVALGDVVFATPPLLARGRVVDDRNRPIARAIVATRWKDKSSRELRPVVDAVAAVDGTFELRGSETADELLVFAAADESASRGDPVPSDGSELVLVIARRGAVEGRIRGVPDEFRPWLSVDLRGKDGFDGKTLGPTDLADDGTFHVENLESGSYDLEVSLSHEGLFGGFAGEKLLRVEDVVVAPGETTRDPRLLDLQPWARVHEVEVHVDLADGASVDRVEATTLSDGWASRWMRTRQGSVVSVPTASDRVDVAVRVAGYRPAVVTSVADRASVTLQPLYRARLVLGPLPAVWSANIPVQLSLECKDHRFPDAWMHVDRELGEGTGCVVWLPSAGKYVGSVEFQDRTPDGESKHVPIAPFTIDDTNDEQTRTLILEPNGKDH